MRMWRHISDDWAITGLPRGLRAEVEGEVARPRWHEAGDGSGAHGAGERRRSGGCEWYQRREEATGSAVLTEWSPEAAAIAGGEERGGGAAR